MFMFMSSNKLGFCSMSLTMIARRCWCECAPRATGIMGTLIIQMDILMCIMTPKPHGLSWFSQWFFRLNQDDRQSTFVKFHVYSRYPPMSINCPLFTIFPQQKMKMFPVQKLIFSPQNMKIFPCCPHHIQSKNLETPPSVAPGNDDQGQSPEREQDCGTTSFRETNMCVYN